MRTLALFLVLFPVAIGAQDPADLRALPTDGRTLVLGASSSGALTPSDPVSDEGGAYTQAWRFQPDTRQTITIDLVSEAFDPVLMVVGPGIGDLLRDDDGGGRCNSRITHTFDPGDYRLIVTSFSFGDGQAGAFTLTASATPPPVAEGSCALPGMADWMTGWEDVTGDALAALPQTGQLARGDSVAGTLDASAADIGGERRGLAYDIAGPAGAQVWLDLSSTTFDTYLYVLHPHHEGPLTDDDAGGGCNSRMVVTLPADGRVRAVVSAFDAEAGGPFVLRAGTAAGPVRQGSCGSTSRFDRDAIEGMETADRLSIGASDEGELTPEDAQLDEYYADVWELDGVAGASAVVELRSDEFDTYLGVTGPGIVGALTNDDAAGRCNSRLMVEFTETGTYRVIATTFREHTLGRYRIAVRRTAGPRDEGPCDFARESARRLAALPLAGAIESGGTVEGYLDFDAPRLSGGSPARVWTLDVEADRTYTVDLSSDAFDTFLLAASPDGMVLEDDDCLGTNARLVLEPAAAGTWRIVASSYRADEGPFTLRVTDGAPASECDGLWDIGIADAGVEYAAVPVVGRLQAGDEYRGAITGGDAVLSDGTYAQAFELTGRAGESATVDLVSDAFDAYLVVLGRGLPDLLYDDDSGGACDSRITLTFPESGTYRVVVSTLAPADTGAYVVRVSREPGPVREDPCNPSP